MSRRGTDKPTGLAGLAAVGIGVCCGLPLLLGAGAVSAAGIALGSVLLAGIGVALGAASLVRRRRRQSCATDPPADTTATIRSGGH